MLTSFKRILVWGGQSFVRNSGSSIVAIVVMVIVILLITSLFVLGKITDFSIAMLEEKIVLTVFFRKDSPEQEIFLTKKELAQLPAIERIEYISEEQALEIFKERHRENPVIMKSLAMLGENPLIAHLNIRAKSPLEYGAIYEYLKGDAFANLVERVNYPQLDPIIARVRQITTGLTNLGIILSIVFGLIAVLVIFNTTKLAIYILKEEIAIMRLVGTSNWFIRGPLIVQGIIFGTLSALISLAIFAVLLFFLSPSIDILLPGLNLFAWFSANLFKIGLINLAVGVGLGVLSSTIAMRKYLTV